MTESSDYESVQVFIGVDVGKDTHHAVAINRSGKRLFDKALPNDENKLRSLISDLKQHGQILLVVDQPATIGALPVAVARSEGVLVGYLPGLAMRRIADLHAGCGYHPHYLAGGSTCCTSKGAIFLCHYCMLMCNSPPRMSQSHSSSPAEYGCAVSRHNLPMSSGHSNMLSPDNVFIAIKPVDMRRGIDALTQYIQDELRSIWHGGAAFVFVNKARSRIKVLRWDKHGVWLCTRRLHKGSFRWPRANDAAWHLTPDEFNWLIAGVDWQQVKGHDLTKWVWQNEPELRPENTQNTLLTN